MGYWCTLHLFDEKKFYQEGISMLKGETGNLSEVCFNFLKNHLVGGFSNLSIHEINLIVEQKKQRIINISSSLDNTFLISSELNNIKDNENRNFFLNNLDGYYDFCKFFEYFVFNYYSDFFPHLILGKGGALRNFDLKVKSISYEIISKLDYWNEFLCGFDSGITNWLSNEDVNLIYLDMENLNPIENNSSEGFQSIIKIAKNKELGLIIGVNMIEQILERLPNNKLINDSIWLEKNSNGLVYEQ